MLTTLPPSHLNKILESGKPVYVVNTSSTPEGNKGTIMCNFFDGRRSSFFKMPPTFIPMAVTDAIPHEMLKNSQDFRQLLIRGALTLVDPMEAMDYLSTDEAQEEYDSLVLSEHTQRYKGIEGEVAKRRTRVSSANNDSRGPYQDDGKSDAVSPKVRGIVEDLTSGNTTAKDALLSLKRHQSALSAADFTYVLSNTTSKKITDWARNAAEDVTGEVPREYEYAKKPKATAKKKSKKESSAKSEKAFDFGSGDKSEMTPEEIRADAEARSRAMAEQSLDGKSKAEDAIQQILAGR